MKHALNKEEINQLQEAMKKPVNEGAMTLIVATSHMNTASWEPQMVYEDSTDFQIKQKYNTVRRILCECITEMAKFIKSYKGEYKMSEEALDNYNETFKVLIECADHAIERNPKAVVIKNFIVSIKPAMDSLKDILLGIKH